MTDAQLIVKNINLKMGGEFNNPALRTLLEHETAVILGDTAPTSAKAQATHQKYVRIQARRTATTSTTSIPGGEVMTPFDDACYAASS